MKKIRDTNEKTLQKPLYRRLFVQSVVIAINSTLAGMIVFWSDSELLDYNIFTIFLDIWYWLLMLPSIVVTFFSCFRWMLAGLMLLLYIINVWIAYGNLAF